MSMFKNDCNKYVKAVIAETWQNDRQWDNEWKQLMLVVVSLELQVFHEISRIYRNSQDCLENSLNPKLISKFPRSGENSQAVAALTTWLVLSVATLFISYLTAW